MHDELADPGNQATHNQLNAATPQLQTAVAGVNDKTSNDLLPAQTSADQGSLKSDDPNTPALPPGPGPNVSDAEAALNQSIKDPHKATHTRAEEKPHPSATSGVANPASRSDTGLGGCKSQL